MVWMCVLIGTVFLQAIQCQTDSKNKDQNSDIYYNAPAVNTDFSSSNKISGFQRYQFPSYDRPEVKTHNEDVDAFNMMKNEKYFDGTIDKSNKENDNYKFFDENNEELYYPDDEYSEEEFEISEKENEASKEFDEKEINIYRNAPQEDNPYQSHTFKNTRKSSIPTRSPISLHHIRKALSPEITSEIKNNETLILKNFSDVITNGDDLRKKFGDTDSSVSPKSNSYEYLYKELRPKTSAESDVSSVDDDGIRYITTKSNETIIIENNSSSQKNNGEGDGIRIKNETMTWEEDSGLQTATLKGSEGTQKVTILKHITLKETSRKEEQNNLNSPKDPKPEAVKLQSRTLVDGVQPRTGIDGETIVLIDGSHIPGKNYGPEDDTFGYYASVYPYDSSNKQTGDFKNQNRLSQIIDSGSKSVIPAEENHQVFSDSGKLSAGENGGYGTISDDHTSPNLHEGITHDSSLKLNPQAGDKSIFEGYNNHGNGISKQYFFTQPSIGSQNLKSLGGLNKDYKGSEERTPEYNSNSASDHEKHPGVLGSIVDDDYTGENGFKVAVSQGSDKFGNQNNKLVPITEADPNQLYIDPFNGQLIKIVYEEDDSKTHSNNGYQPKQYQYNQKSLSDLSNYQVKLLKPVSYNEQTQDYSSDGEEKIANNVNDIDITTGGYSSTDLHNDNTQDENLNLNSNQYPNDKGSQIKLPTYVEKFKTNINDQSQIHGDKGQQYIILCDKLQEHIKSQDLKGYQQIQNQGYEQNPNQKGYEQIQNQNGYELIQNQNGYEQIQNQNGYEQIKNQKGYEQIPNPKEYEQIQNQNGYEQIKNQKGYEQIQNPKGYEQILNQKGYEQIQNQKGYEQNQNQQEYHPGLNTNLSEYPDSQEDTKAYQELKDSHFDLLRKPKSGKGENEYLVNFKNGIVTKGNNFKGDNIESQYEEKGNNDYSGSLSNFKGASGYGEGIDGHLILKSESPNLVGVHNLKSPNISPGSGSLSKGVNINHFQGDKQNYQHIVFVKPQSNFKGTQYRPPQKGSSKGVRNHKNYKTSLQSMFGFNSGEYIPMTKSYNGNHQQMHFNLANDVKSPIMNVKHNLINNNKGSNTYGQNYIKGSSLQIQNNNKGSSLYGQNNIKGLKLQGQNNIKGTNIHNQNYNDVHDFQLLNQYNGGGKNSYGGTGKQNIKALGHFKGIGIEGIAQNLKSEGPYDHSSIPNIHSNYKGTDKGTPFQNSKGHYESSGHGAVKGDISGGIVGGQLDSGILGGQYSDGLRGQHNSGMLRGQHKDLQHYVDKDSYKNKKNSLHDVSAFGVQHGLQQPEEYILVEVDDNNHNGNIQAHGGYYYIPFGGNNKEQSRYANQNNGNLVNAGSSLGNKHSNVRFVYDGGKDRTYQLKNLVVTGMHAARAVLPLLQTPTERSIKGNINFGVQIQRNPSLQVPQYRIDRMDSVSNSTKS